MWVLFLFITVCLVRGITPLDLEHGNLGVHDGEISNTSYIFSTRGSIHALDVTTHLPDPQIPSNAGTTLFLDTKSEEVSNTSEGQQDIVKNEWDNKQLIEKQIEPRLPNFEFALVGDLTRAPSFEEDVNEPVYSTDTTDIMYTTLENITQGSILQEDNLTVISSDVVSNERLVKTSSQSNVSSNVEQDTPIGLEKSETSPEYTLHGSTPQQYLDEGKDFLPSSSVTEMKSHSLESLSTTTDFEALTPVREHVSNTDEKTSRGNKFLDIQDQFNNSNTFNSENSEGYFLDTTDTSVNKSLEKYNEDPIESFSAENNNGDSLNYLLNATGKNVSTENSTVDVSLNYSSIVKGENILGENSPVDFSSSDNNENTFVENSTADVSSIILGKLSTTASFIPKEFFTKYPYKYTSYTQENSEEESFVSTPSSKEQNISDYAKEKSASPPSKDSLNQRYKLRLTRNCSGDVFASHTFQSISAILNTMLNAHNSTKFLKCVSMYEFNFTSDVESHETFTDAIQIIQEKVDSDLYVSILSMLHEIQNTEYDSENFIIPRLVVYISAAATIIIILFMIVIICLRKRCKKSSSSLDLSDIPHLALSVDDYKVAPIPRPSVSFPESNRDFLYAYSNETYNRSKDGNGTLMKRHSANTTGKEFDALKMQKENSLALEMKTFTRKDDNGRYRHDSRSVPGYEYTTPNFLDRIGGRGIAKKQGVDNPGMRW